MARPARWLLCAWLLSGAGCTRHEIQVEESPPDFLVEAPAATARDVMPPSAEFVEPLVVTPSALLEPLGATTVGDVRSVRVKLLLEGRPLPSALEVEFAGPGDLPYRSERALVQPLGPGAGEASFVLLVAGTVIDSRSLHGGWVARFLLDGEEISTQPFELLP